MSEKSYPLIEQFKFYNLDYLVPMHFGGDDSDEEGMGHTRFRENERELDPTEDAYYDDYFYAADDEYEDDEDEDPAECCGAIHLAYNMDDMLRIFNVDYLEPSELLSMNVWDLFDVTKNQFDMINWSEIDPEDFPKFYETFLKEKRDISIEKRIRYSLAEAVTDYSSLTCCHGDECTSAEMREYIEHVIDTRTLPEFVHFVKLLSDYLVRFYNDALEMNRRRARNGEPTFKYVRRPKPSHLRDLHDKAFRDYQTMETERLLQNREHIENGINGISKTHQYKQFLFSNKEYTVLPVEGQVDLDFEGERLNHCVASYGGAMSRGESYIYRIRRISEINEPYFTAEIVPPKRSGESYKLNQCYTYNDTIAKSDSLKTFIKDWSKKTQFVIKCEI